MSENKPLTQSLKLEDNFTSVLDKIGKKLKATTGVLNDFAKLGSTPVSLSMEVKDEEFKTSISGIKREFDSLTSLANKGIRMDMYTEQFEEQSNKIKEMRNTYNNALEGMEEKSRSYQKTIELTKERLSLLNEKAELIQSKMFNTTDDGKLNQLSLQMNTVDGQIQKTVGTLEQQKQKLLDSQEAMNFLANRSRDLEKAYESAAKAAQSMADVPSKAEEKENRRIAQIQTLKDKYDEATRSQEILSNSFKMPKGLGDTTSTLQRLEQTANLAFNKMNMGITKAQIKAKQLEGTIANQGRGWIDASFEVDKFRNKIDSIQTKYLGLSRGQIGWNGLIRAGSSAFSSLISKMKNTKNSIDNATQSQKGFTKEIGSSSRSMRSLNTAARLINFNFAIAGARKLYDTLGKVMEKVDDMTNINTKINMISDTPEQAIQNKKNIMGAANDSRSSFADTSDFVTKVAINSGDAFNNTDEIVKFTNTLQKMYKMGGATTAEQQSSMMQLQQSLAQGYMQGQELNSVMKGAPLLIQAIADELGVTRGELKEMGKDGEISADVIRRAMFSASADIDKQFSEMPKKWEDYTALMKNAAFDAFGQIQEKITNFLNSSNGQELINNLIAGIYMLADAVMIVFNIAASAITWIKDNIELVTNVIVTLGVIAAAVGTVMFISWMMVNYPIVLAGLAIFSIINILNELGISTSTIVQFIIGNFMFLGTLVYNGILYIVGVIRISVNAIINQFILMVNSMITLAEFFYNVWKHPIDAVKMLLFNLVKSGVDYFAAFIDSSYKVGEAIAKAFLWGANKAIQGINLIIEALNKIPGVDIGNVGEIDTSVDFSGVGDNMRKGIMKFEPEVSDDYKKFNKMEYRTTDGMNNAINNMANPFTSFDRGFNAFNGLGNIISGGFNKMGDWNKGQEDWAKGIGGSDYSGVASPDNGYSPDSKAAKKIGKGKDLGNVDADAKIKDEDLKYLRDIAEKQFTVNYQQLTPQATVNYYGAGGTDEDVDRLLGRMEAMISEKSDANLY